MNKLTIMDIRNDIKKETTTLLNVGGSSNVPIMELLTTSILMLTDKYKSNPYHVELVERWMYDAYITSEPKEAVLLQILSYDNESYRTLGRLSKRHIDIDRYMGKWTDLLFPHTFNSDATFDEIDYGLVPIHMQVFIDRLLSAMEQCFNFISTENNIVVDELFLVTKDEYSEYDDSLTCEYEELVDKLNIFTTDVTEVDDPSVQSIFKSFEVKRFFETVNSQNLDHPPKYISINKILKSTTLTLCKTLIKHLNEDEQESLINYIFRNVSSKLEHVYSKFINQTEMVDIVIMAHIKCEVEIGADDVYSYILSEIGGNSNEECVHIYNKQGELYRAIEHDVRNAMNEVSHTLLSPISEFFLAVNIKDTEQLHKVGNIFNEMVDEIYRIKTCISKIINSNVALRKIYSVEDEEDPVDDIYHHQHPKRLNNMLVSELYEILDRLSEEQLEAYYNTKLKYRRVVLESFNRVHGGKK